VRSSSARSAVIAPEAELLVALGKPRPSAADWTRAAAAQANPAFTWTEAMRLARVHKVQPMLAWNLKARDAEAFAGLPPAVRQELGTALLAARTRRERYHTTLVPVFERLAARGIPLVLMKGAIVMETAYPPGARWLNDLDALVSVADRLVAVETFAEYGFRLTSALPEPDAYHQVSLVHDGDDRPPLCVDLHWDVVYRPRSPFTFDAAGIIRGARAIGFGGVRVLAMSDEETIVHYATQVFGQFFKTRLVRFADMCSLLDGAQMERLVAAAAAAGAAGITHTALGALALLDVTVPRRVLDDLAREQPRCAIGSELLVDYRWLLNDSEAAWGAMTVAKGAYLATPGQRRRYWLSLPSDLYRRSRREGSNLSAAQAVVSGLCAVALCGGVLLMLAGTSRKHGRVTSRMRDLLWRAP